MKKQLLAISLCILMIGLIPLSAAGMKPQDPASNPRTTEIGRTIIRGLVIGYKPGGVITRFFAIRIHFTQITGAETTSGVLRFQHVNAGKFIGGYSNDFMVKGIFTYLFAATFRGGISAL